MSKAVCTDERIIRIIQNLPVGGTHRTDCPMCGGTRCALLSCKSYSRGYIYCFRNTCGYSAGVDLNIGTLRDMQKHIELPDLLTTTKSDGLPYDSINISAIDSPYTEMLVNPAIVWVSKAGLSPEDTDSCIFYSPYRRAAVIPCEEHGYNMGLLYRPLPRPAGGWKYYFRHQRKGGALWAPHGNFPKSWETVVIVEDVLSCLRLRAIGIPSVSCLGTYCNISIMAHLLELNFARVIVFLDGDHAGSTGARRFKNALELNGIPFCITSVEGKDPKDCTNAELKAVIEKCY